MFIRGSRMHVIGGAMENPSRPSHTPRLLWCVFGLLFTLVLSARPGQANAALTKVTAITLEETTGEVQVAIAISGPLRYERRNVQPNLIVVDVLGAELSMPAGTLPLRGGPVKKIRVGQFAPDVARVVVELIQPTPARFAVSPDQSAIVIGIPADVTGRPPTIPATRSAGPAQTARVKVTAITLEETASELQVKITASGPVRYQRRDVQPDWIVLDLPDAGLGMRAGTLPLGRGLVKRIRVGQFTPDVVRVVVELVQPVQVRLASSADRSAIMAAIPTPTSGGTGSPKTAPPPAASGGTGSPANPPPPTVIQTRLVQTSGYVLGPEDVLEVTVWGYPDLTGVAPVRPDGKVSVPLAGPVHASGLSVEQLTQELTRAYATYIINPQVAVTVKEFRKIRVSVLGQVAHPGTYFLPPGSRLLDALSAAGGATDVAALTDAQLLPPRGAPVGVDLQRALAGAPAANVFLRGGETLVVPEDLVNFVSLNGEVVHPGRYRLKGEMHILDALLAAGGLTDRASVTQTRLVRASHESASFSLESLLLRQDMSQNITLSPGDTLFIPVETNTSLYVMGDVKNPGIYPIKGQVTLLQAIAMAGGPVQRGIGTAKTAYVVRHNNGAPTQEVFASARATNVKPIGDRGVLMTVDLRAMMHGDLDQDETMRPGDVVVIPETGLNALQLVLNMISTIIFGIHYFP